VMGSVWLAVVTTIYFRRRRKTLAKRRCGVAKHASLWTPQNRYFYLYKRYSAVPLLDLAIPPSVYSLLQSISVDRFKFTFGVVVVGPDALRLGASPSRSSIMALALSHHHTPLRCFTNPVSADEGATRTTSLE
jgi:hypothetical protein